MAYPHVLINIITHILWE